MSIVENQTFAELGVIPEIVSALEKVDVTHPFPIQALTLPVPLQRHDIIGQAKTGTGKTLGFGIPLLQHVIAPGEAGFEDQKEPGAPQGLIVVPTRELAVQVAKDLEQASTTRKVRVLQIYGGRAFEPQVNALQRGVEVVVGTPGRLLDLLRQRYLNLNHVKTAVLDEADEMLDLGFLEDVEKILAATPPTRHTMLFSATMPGAVVALARRYMTQPTHIRAQDPEDSGATVRATKQFVYRAHAMDKIEVLARILQAEDRGLTIVFTRTKRTAAKVTDDLNDRGFAAGAIHGDLGQGAREQALRAFRSGKVDVLVATDVAARGIDVDNVTHVINYQCPEDEKVYLHRIGRTGRAGLTGTAITFVDWDDVPRWSVIDRTLDLGFPEPVETYSSSDHLFTDQNIPAGTKGVLPKDKRTRAGLEAEKLEDIGETGKRTIGAGSQGGRSGHGGRSGRGGRGGRGGSSRRDGRGGGSSRGDGRGGSSSRGDGRGGGSSRGDGTRRRKRTRRGQNVNRSDAGQSGASQSTQTPTGAAQTGAPSGSEQKRGAATQANRHGNQNGQSKSGQRRSRRRHRTRGGNPIETKGSAN